MPHWGAGNWTAIKRELNAMPGISTLIKLAAGFLAGAAVVSQISVDTFLLRPPGAGSEAEFLSKCIRCGKCVAACPYHILKAADSKTGASAGTPTFVARDGACRLCTDFPCVAACPTTALSGIETRQDVRIGRAVVNRDLCIALKGMRCEVCYRSCPLIDEAIVIKKQAREGDSIHTIFEPVIITDKCVGCGICEERCVIYDPALAIRVAPHTGIYEPYNT